MNAIKPRSKVKGLSGKGSVSIVISVETIGNDALQIVFEDQDGQINNRVLFSDELHEIEILSEGQFWTFDADGKISRMAIECLRIKLAHFFDPYLAINTSLVDPLPHQITAVYDEMLGRQPLRFLLADDPGAGKTIMAGLLIKELIARGDLERCLVVAPGGLVEQWQDELGEKFKLEFEILSNDSIQNSRTGNPFNDKNLLIARLDVLARNEEIREKLLNSTEWDIIISDEAHRMSASYFGGDVQYTKRYQLGQKLSQICRHFLLMTATPHNGKEEDFQLFMALLDGDRFEGKFRDSAHVADTRDMMRRLTKEDLLKFDGKPLFPERKAFTIKYTLSDPEASLYSEVTEYVRYEMNRVKRFENDNKKRVNVGFALQILQRRLASSPAAIYNSIKRRRIRLEKELNEARIVARGKKVSESIQEDFIDDEMIDNIEEYSQDDIEGIEEKISATATTAETIEELEKEIETLKSLEKKSLVVLRSGQDTKWLELNKILDNNLMTDQQGNRRKLIIFTEAKDTLNYLVEKIRTRIGKTEAVDFIHGGVLRGDRRQVINRFMQDKSLFVLVANDAAGEGVNLQRGHLMVNYDLPWNPNKIEQRFGRIHRIGQTEVCYLWNLVAAETREGDVYAKLLEKLEAAKAALHGQVFDVLGDLFNEKSLRDLLWEAIQYGEREDVRSRLNQAIEDAVDVERIKKIMKERKLTDDILHESEVEETRLKMERAEAHRLQPHHIQGFFMEAFSHLGGKVYAKEQGRFEIKNVPLKVRERNRLTGKGAPLGKKYERVCFDKKYINQQPVAEFICPGHPLLEAVISLIRENYNHLLKQGAVMVDESDYSTKLQVIFLLENEIKDARKTSSGFNQTISKKLHFVRLTENDQIGDAGLAPHLNLRPIKEDEKILVSNDLNADWLKKDIENKIKNYSIMNLAQEHLIETKKRRLSLIDKIQKEVEERLKKEIRYWDNRAAVLKEEEKAGKKTKASWQNAERRAGELTERLQRRLEQLNDEKQISASPPSIVGGLVIVPAGLLAIKSNDKTLSQDSRKEIEIIGMQTIMDTEKNLGNIPEDVSDQKVGYDILSFNPITKKHRFIEVKGRTSDAKTVTVTRNEIITALNKPEDYILALVSINDGTVISNKYVWKPFDIEPSFDTVSVNFDLSELTSRAIPPQ